MMGIGCGAGGISSSSTSNLSALAPPFTVDRLNRKPNSDPILHYSESPCAIEPYSHQWQYVYLSAPIPEMVINTTGITTVPVSDDYRFSSSLSISPSTAHWSGLSSGTKATGGEFAYGGEIKPYYSPQAHVPSMVGEDRLFVEDEGSHYNVVPTSGQNVTSQHDYTQGLFDLEYSPQWVDSSGYDDGKRAKRSECDGSLSSGDANVGGSKSYKNQLYQGGHYSENRHKPKEGFGVLYQNFNRVYDREAQIGSSSTEYMEDKSCLKQNLGIFHHTTNRSLVALSSSPYPESYPSVVSCDMRKNFPNYQNSCSPYEKSVRADTPFLGPESVVRASPTVVIRPPPAITGNEGQSIVSHRPVCGENVGDVHSVGFDCINPSKLKDPFRANLLNFSKQESNLISSSSLKELPTPLHSLDASDCKTKARFGSQLSDINASRGFAVAGDNVQIVNSTEFSSDIMDHHNTTVDSPCWKGVPFSQFSTFDLEAGNSNHVEIKLDGHYGFGHEGHRNLQPVVDSNRVFHEKFEGNMRNENECTRNGVPLALERTLDTICSVESSDGPKMPIKEHNLLNNLTSVFDMKVSDTKHLIGEEGAEITGNDVSEGAAVAVHAAEKVLASPASQEDATEHTIVPNPKLNVPAMIKAMRNLSELVCYHLSNDACSLEEENTETLRCVINNLSTCLSKDVFQATIEPESNNSVGDTSKILGDSCNVGTISGGLHMKNVAASSQNKFDDLHMHDEVRRYPVPGKKYDKSTICSPLRDDFDITGNDDMAKSIKKILEENFQFNEKMHSQAFRFKSLWLEAEAKLCSISYKARFDRMKNQMEENKRKGSQEMMSQFSISPDPITTSELAPKACDGTSLKPSLQNISISRLIGHVDDIEASVLARFNILKSREVSPKLINTEEEHQPEMVDGDTGSIMARFNILRSHEKNSKPISMYDEKQTKTSDGAGEKYLRPCISDQSEDETLNVARQPHLLHQSGSTSDSRFGSYLDGAEYKSMNEYHLSVKNDPINQSFKSSSMINENNSGWRDSSSSSDWEHVLKDYFSWKKF